MHIYFRVSLFLLVSFLLHSCNLWEKKEAVLWTDRPEFVFYVEQFNASQDRYKIEAYYHESVAQKLTERGPVPDIVASSWLKNASIRVMFRPLDDLFKNESPGLASFYPRLLAQGIVDGRQYLLPVSFNIPAMVFASGYSHFISNPFTISMDEIQKLSSDYNIETNGVYTRMGFSPSWNDDFLFIVVTLFNAGFREASPIAWDPAALERAVILIQEWIDEANSGIQADDEFVFKYLYDPEPRLISSGRILFANMNSSDFFIMPAEQRQNLDFRWIAEMDSIPLDESAVSYGIHRHAKARNAAYAFTRWFFKADTQRQLLDLSKSKRLNETSFGISGGFSGMRTVTEQIFPLFYPSLLGRMPPEAFLSPPAILPHNWMDLKERVVLPYLRDRIRHATRDEVRPLERRVADWHRLNRE